MWSNVYALTFERLAKEASDEGRDITPEAWAEDAAVSADWAVRYMPQPEHRK